MVSLCDSRPGDSAALNSLKVSSKPFTIIECNLSGSSLVFGVEDLSSQVGRVVVAGRPVLQQALDKLVQVEFLLFMFLVRPELPERPRAEGPEEAGGWRRGGLTWSSQLGLADPVQSDGRGRGAGPGLVGGEPLETPGTAELPGTLVQAEDLTQRAEVLPGDCASVLTVQLREDVLQVLVEVSRQQPGAVLTPRGRLSPSATVESPEVARQGGVQESASLASLSGVPV